jgi:erythromycin esterase-like protein
MPLVSKTIVALALLLPLAGPAPANGAADALHRALASLAQPLRDDADLTPLVAAAGGARVVLLGEATHGTREFYAWRDRLSRRLLAAGGFSFVAIEGDWAALLPLDRYVRHHPAAAASARAALLQVERWPRWLLANTELATFAEWLRAFNAGRPAAERVGIHGIDLYALAESLDAVLAFYQARWPQTAERVRRLHRFLAGFGGDGQAYAEYVRRTGSSAQDEVDWLVRDLTRRYQAALPEGREALFEALQDARVVAGGERYRRLRAAPGPLSWNARAQHFEQAVIHLLEHYGPGSRAIVWAHNTHVGDARATDMRFTGELSLGQLARQRHGAAAVYVVGFGTALGRVLAAPRWEGPVETMPLPAPRPDSLEAALLASGRGDRLFILDRHSPALRPLHRRLPQRAIGVVFDPRTEPRENYLPASLAQRYDAFVFLPYTRALEPLHQEPLPRTFR